MVVGFRRTISFPAPRSPAPPAGPSAANNKSVAYRARSASLPCRFHPLVLQLDDDVADLRALVGRLASRASAEAVAEAAARLGRVLASLSGLLHHPQAQDPLRRLGPSPFAERLLDDFLRLADAHGSFRDALVALAALQAEARAALRKEEPARLASAARAARVRAGPLAGRLLGNRVFSMPGQPVVKLGIWFGGTFARPACYGTLKNLHFPLLVQSLTDGLTADTR